MGLLPLSLTRPSVTETSHEYSQTTCTSQASVHTSGSGCGGSCNPTCLLTLFLPAAPSLLSACTSPGAVCHHHLRTPCQRQMGIRERSTAVLPSHPKDLKRRWEKEWQLFMCSCPERRPQLCCSRPPASMPRAVESLFIPRKPCLPDSWCFSHRTVENTYFLHTGSCFLPALRSHAGPFPEMIPEAPFSLGELNTEP